MAVTMRGSLGLLVLLLSQGALATYDIGQFSQQIAQQTVRVAARGCMRADARWTSQLSADIANAHSR